MITFLKKINRYVIYAVLGVLGSFAMLEDLLTMTSTTAYSSGMSFGAMLPWVIIFSVVLLGFIIKLLVYITFRIDNAIFVRKSGLLYPFPIPFTEFELTACAFLLPALLLGGLAHLPVLFLPSLSRILGAVRSLILYGSVVAAIAYVLKKYAHDYDKNSLANALILLPTILLSVSFVLTLVEVIR